MDAYASNGVDHQVLAAQLQRDGAGSFDTSWKSLLASIASKHDKLAPAGD